MTKLTIKASDSPSEQIIAKAQKCVTVVDSTGRKIVLRRPPVLAQFQLVEVAGNSAKNEVWMRMVFPLIYVSEIGGQAETLPQNRLQLDGLIQRLDEHGIAAVMSGVVEHFDTVDGDKEKEAIKK